MTKKLLSGGYRNARGGGLQKQCRLWRWKWPVRVDVDGVRKMSRSLIFEHSLSQHRLCRGLQTTHHHPKDPSSTSAMGVVRDFAV